MTPPIMVDHPTGRPNFTIVTLPGKLEIAFSYATPIAFSANGTWIKRENVWGPTTGKHLNYIPGRNVVDGDTFETMMAGALQRIGQ